jgi:transposase
MASNPQLHLMTKLLNIEGMTVKNYQIIENIGITIYLDNNNKKAICPDCGKKTDKLHQNHYYVVRDLPWGEQKVYLQVNRRQMRCESCPKKFSEDLEFVKKTRTYTERLKKKILSELLESDVKNVAQRNGVSEQEIETMLKEWGRELSGQKPSGLKRLGIDEIALVKGQKNYCVVLVDIDKKIIVGMLKNRTQVEIKKYLEAWGEEVLEQIEEVSIDMWKPYKNVSEALMPQAEVVADRFHVMKQVNEELDGARKKIKKAAVALKNNSEKARILSGIKKTKYVLLKNESHLTEIEKEQLESVKKVAPTLHKMHQLKEEFIQIFEAPKDWVEGLFSLSDWLKDAISVFPKSCRTIIRWIGQIIPYFDRRTTQGVVEGINNKLKLIKRKAYGFRNFDNFILRSFLHWHFAS